MATHQTMFKNTRVWRCRESCRNHNGQEMGFCVTTGDFRTSEATNTVYDGGRKVKQMGAENTHAMRVALNKITRVAAGRRAHGDIAMAMTAGIGGSLPYQTRVLATEGAPLVRGLPRSKFKAYEVLRFPGICIHGDTRMTPTIHTTGRGLVTTRAPMCEVIAAMGDAVPPECIVPLGYDPIRYSAARAVLDGRPVHDKSALTDDEVQKLLYCVFTC
jgi:hypothetical protein